MEKIIYFDKEGRIYIPEEMRRIFQHRAMVARAEGGMICLEPVDADPLEALSKLGKGKFKGKSIQQLKRDARKEIEENAIKKIRR